MIDVVLLKTDSIRKVFTHSDQAGADRRVDALVQLHGPRTVVDTDDDGVIFVDARHYYTKLAAK